MPTRAIGSALETLAFIARNETDRRGVREELSTHLLSRRDAVRVAAINALGTLGDDGAIATLEPFAAGATDAPETKPAEAALTRLRAERKPADTTRDLRRELDTLKKDSEAMRKELDSLKSQTNAAPQEKPDADR